VQQNYKARISTSNFTTTHLVEEQRSRLKAQFYHSQSAAHPTTTTRHSFFILSTLKKQSTIDNNTHQKSTTNDISHINFKATAGHTCLKMLSHKYHHMLNRYLRGSLQTYSYLCGWPTLAVHVPFRYKSY